MSLPISVGDALLLSQLAYKIGRAFTSGRKSAPAEFAEIQDLLFTLTEALKLLAQDLPDDGPLDTDASTSRKADEARDEMVLLSQMIINCQSTLTHLSGLIEKYMEIDGRNLEQKEDKRWKDEVRKNWKKILWTKEGGDIAKLKVTLTAHINGLNLAVNSIDLRHGVIVKGEVQAMRSKLDAIYAWFQQNLEGRKASTVPSSRKDNTAPQFEEGGLFFSITVNLSSSDESQGAFCSRASFQPDWLEPIETFYSPRSIFRCHCNHSPSGREHAGLKVSLLPSSLLIRVAQSKGPKWQIYVALMSHANRNNSIYISDVEPSNISSFEKQVTGLALCQAKKQVERGRSSVLVAIQPYLNGGGMVHVLSTKTDIQSNTKSEDTCRVTFRVSERHFNITAHSLYSVLHYKSITDSTIRVFSESRNTEPFMLHQPHADLVFQSLDSRAGFLNDVDHQYYIIFYHNTRITPGESQRTVKLFNVMCVSEQKQSGLPAVIQQIKCDSTEIEFNSSQHAVECIKNLQSMQRELFATYLQYPRCGEQIVFQRSSGTVIIRDQIITGAHVVIVLNLLDEQYRIILQNSSHSLAVCVELPAQVIESLATEADKITNQYPAYFFRISKKDIDILRENIKLNELMIPGPDGSLYPLLGHMEALSLE